MAAYLPLAEAAAKLGIAPERLVELRSSGELRGFRDGTSWKFPEGEIQRLQQEVAEGRSLTDDFGDSGMSLGDPINQSASSSGSDLELDLSTDASDESVDVSLVPSGSAVLGAAAGSGTGSGVMMDLDDLQIAGSAVSHGSDIELAGIDEGGAEGGSGTGTGSGLELELDDDSGDDVLGGESLSLDSDLKLDSAVSGESLDENPPSASGMVSGDVLSELDMLAGGGGSGLATGGKSGVGGSGLGSDLDLSDIAGDDVGSAIDDALADDDDLIIADDDDDLILDAAGSDISIAGDSGINLMSPSDSGLSLENEPLDLAGSSISALDLGAELADSGSAIGSKARADGSAIDFQTDEEFQLSASGVHVEDGDSASQVIDVEDSDASQPSVGFDAGGSDAFEDGGVFGDADGGFAEAPAGDGFGEDADAADGFGVDPNSNAAPVGAGYAAAYEIPFTLLQTVGLVLILCIMSLGGMLMTDLIRNMWTYTEPAAPVSSLTDMLISAIGWDS